MKVNYNFSMRITRLWPLLVNTNLWSFVLSSAPLFFTFGIVLYIHGYQSGSSLSSLGFFLLLLVSSLWLRDVVREATYEGHHTSRDMVSLLLNLSLIGIEFDLTTLTQIGGFIYSLLAIIVLFIKTKQTGTSGLKASGPVNSGPLNTGQPEENPKEKWIRRLKQAGLITLQVGGAILSLWAVYEVLKRLGVEIEIPSIHFSKPNLPPTPDESVSVEEESIDESVPEEEESVQQVEVGTEEVGTEEVGTETDSPDTAEIGTETDSPDIKKRGTQTMKDSRLQKFAFTLRKILDASYESEDILNRTADEYQIQNPSLSNCLRSVVNTLQAAQRAILESDVSSSSGSDVSSSSGGDLKVLRRNLKVSLSLRRNLKVLGAK